MSGDLPVPRERGEVAPADLSRAAWKGSVATAVPALLLAAPVPFLWQTLFWGSVRALKAYMPYALARNVMGLVVWMLPALIAVPVGWVVARAVRKEAAVHPSRGRAVAAGACMGATVACTLVIVGKNLLSFEPGWIGLQVMGAALGVGVLGARSFGASGGEGRRGEIPALYQGLTVAGATVPLFFLASVLWGLAALAIPALSLMAILRATGLLAWIGSYSIASLLIVLPLLAPVAYLSGRLARRLFPEAQPGVLRAGLILPAAVVLAYTTLPWIFSAKMNLTLARGLGLAAAWMLGMTTHSVAAGLALPAEDEETQEALPGGVNEPPAPP